MSRPAWVTHWVEFNVRMWMSFWLKASLRNHVCLWWEKEEEENRQQMSEWLSKNKTRLIQLYRGSKFKLTVQFLCMQVILPRGHTHTHTTPNDYAFTQHNQVMWEKYVSGCKRTIKATLKDHRETQNRSKDARRPQRGARGNYMTRSESANAIETQSGGQHGRKRSYTITGR